MEPFGATGLRKKLSASQKARICLDVQKIIGDATTFQMQKTLQSPEDLPATPLSVDETNKSQPFVLASDTCRICQSEATPENPLYHPCICTGSIKFVHQQCLLQWLKYSRKNYCDLCSHRFSFMPVYSPDMPKRLPVKDIFSGLLRCLSTAARFLLHYILVGFAWLRIVPLTACRTYRCLFTEPLSSILSLPLDIFSIENLSSESLCGCCVVMCTLCAVNCLTWFTVQILRDGGPEWLEADHNMIDQLIEFANNILQDVAPQAGVPDDDDIGPNVGDEGNNEAQADANNWNPFAFFHRREFTWGRFLGLDGSFHFLIHVFGLVYLNIVFIVVFAFCPYHIGQFVISCFGFKEYIVVPGFEGLLTAILGYINIGIILSLLHGAAALTRLRLIRRLLGISYIVLKLALFFALHLGIFPLLYGWWIDIFSLTMLDATIHDRGAGFKLAPGMSMFIHWLAGMIYVFYFQSFMQLLRSVLPPGVLWFHKNPNDPNFNPVTEMIHFSLLREIREELLLFAKHGTWILLAVWLPVRIIEKIAPDFLPYHLQLSSELPYNGLLELVLLVLVLPVPVGQGHMRQFFKFFVRTWYIGISYILDIPSYILDDVSNNKQKLCVIFFFCISLTLGSLAMTTIPVFVGRKLMSLSFGNAKVYELYTIGCGLCVCWVMLRIFTLLRSWIPRGWTIISAKLKELLKISFRMLCAMSVLLGLIPILMGLLLDLLLIVPVRVAINQTPFISIWQDWAVGVLLTMTFCAIVSVGPNCWMRRVIVQVYLGGIHNINLHAIFMDLALPVIMVVGLSLSVPYIIACSIIPMFCSSFELQDIVIRRIYPFLLACVLTLSAIVLEVHLFIRLCEKIRIDKYLIGKRLVNYGH